MTTASDIRPSHADLDALFACTSMTVETRHAVIDALGKGRLSVGDVDRALEKFDELTRTQVLAVLSSVGALA